MILLTAVYDPSEFSHFIIVCQAKLTMMFVKQTRKLRWASQAF